MLPTPGPLAATKRASSCMAFFLMLSVTLVHQTGSQEAEMTEQEPKLGERRDFL
ncbi:phytanoyl-CoA dioxygenase domain containing 1, isoform CRA_c [Rattus norvegicus]|uniref:Phytanoyl-CoA dioxygenase domain containing 1, isoform CRA_c n=1 Tax=Rattus norvegicus TaxID=10116 RepID=A6JTW8_RAT|nr:phytanoyl-CoA dioxygenase domain containing 1, isoform CRA_c [Rattus norvegicus]